MSSMPNVNFTMPNLNQISLYHAHNVIIETAKPIVAAVQHAIQDPAISRQIVFLASNTLSVMNLTLAGYSAVKAFRCFKQQQYSRATFYTGVSIGSLALGAINLYNTWDKAYSEFEPKTIEIKNFDIHNKCLIHQTHTQFESVIHSLAAFLGKSSEPYFQYAGDYFGKPLQLSPLMETTRKYIEVDFSHCFNEANYANKIACLESLV